MKPRPSLKEIIRTADIESFIRDGKASPEASETVPPDHIRVTLDIPRELHEALMVVLEGKDISLPQALREMLAEYIMKDWDWPTTGEPPSSPG
ncbi:MAG: hypothetical protein ACYC9S_10410 [Leptospirales bacterium]